MAIGLQRPKRREHDHFNLVRHQCALLGFCCHLDHTIDLQHPGGIGRSDLSHATDKLHRHPAGRGHMPSKKPAWDRPCPQFISAVFWRMLRSRHPADDEFLQRHVILVARSHFDRGSGPPGYSLTRLLPRLLQLGLSPHDGALSSMSAMASAARAYHQSAVVWLPAIEIRIVQYFDSFFRFLQ